MGGIGGMGRMGGMGGMGRMALTSPFSNLSHLEPNFRLCNPHLQSTSPIRIFKSEI
jgi:hypothetical protein